MHSSAKLRTSGNHTINNNGACNGAMETTQTHSTQEITLLITAHDGVSKGNKTGETDWNTSAFLHHIIRLLHLKSMTRFQDRPEGQTKHTKDKTKSLSLKLL